MSKTKKETLTPKQVERLQNAALKLIDNINKADLEAKKVKGNYDIVTVTLHQSKPNSIEDQMNQIKAIDNYEGFLELSSYERFFLIRHILKELKESGNPLFKDDNLNKDDMNAKIAEKFFNLLHSFNESKKNVYLSSLALGYANLVFPNLNLEENDGIEQHLGDRLSLVQNLIKNPSKLAMDEKKDTTLLSNCTSRFKDAIRDFLTSKHNKNIELPEDESNVNQNNSTLPPTQ